MNLIGICNNTYTARNNHTTEVGGELFGHYVILRNNTKRTSPLGLYTIYLTSSDSTVDIYAPLPDESLGRICKMAEKIEVPKGTLIIEADKVCHDIYFIGRGIVRAFCIAKGRDITFWIGEEGTVALSMQSYINRAPGYENIITLEDCTLYRISASQLHSLYQQDIHLANWGRVFAEKEILRAESALIPQLFTTGRERYEQLLRQHPHLLNRIPLENLATYLGLTPVSLSRIRHP